MPMIIMFSMNKSIFTELTVQLLKCAVCMQLHFISNGEEGGPQVTVYALTRHPRLHR